MEAIILAGGKAERLGAAASAHPADLAQVERADALVAGAVGPTGLAANPAPSTLARCQRGPRTPGGSLRVSKRRPAITM